MGFYTISEDGTYHGVVDKYELEFFSFPVFADILWGSSRGIKHDGIRWSVQSEACAGTMA